MEENTHIPAKDRTVEVLVLDTRRHAPNLVSFRTSRPDGFSFTPGHYSRLGVQTPDGPAMRPLSILSRPSDPWLEFLVTIVPDGSFSSRIDSLSPGDSLLLDPRALGFLTADSLSP